MDQIPCASCCGSHRSNPGSSAQHVRPEAARAPEEQQKGIDSRLRAWSSGSLGIRLRRSLAAAAETLVPRCGFRNGTIPDSLHFCQGDPGKQAEGQTRRTAHRIVPQNPGLGFPQQEKDAVGFSGSHPFSSSGIQRRYEPVRPAGGYRS